MVTMAPLPPVAGLILPEMEPLPPVAGLPEVVDEGPEDELGNAALGWELHPASTNISKENILCRAKP